MASVKTCTKCGADKPTSEFYRRRDQKDGLATRCISCSKEYAHSHRAENLELVRSQEKSCRNNPEAKLRMKEYNKKYREENKARLSEQTKARLALPHVREAFARNAANTKARHPERVKARQVLNKAVRNGKVEKLPCMVCGADKSEAHHTSYSEPLVVVWLCKGHHEQVHAEHEQYVASLE